MRITQVRDDGKVNTLRTLRIEQIDAFTGEDSKRIKRISDSTERNRKNEFINRLGKGISPA